MTLSRTPILKGPPISLDSAKESDLVREVAADSPDALAALYRLHGGALFRLARRLTASVQDAEDVLHDLFVGLPEAVRKYDGRGSFQGWLKRVLVRHALMHLRAQRRRREVALGEQVAETAPGRRPEDSGSWDVQHAIAALPDDLRAVLVLRQTEGYAHGEIAVLLGITPGASRVRL